MRTITPLMIFSTDRTDKQLGLSALGGEVMRSRNRLRGVLAIAEAGIRYTPCEGRWSGNTEVSFALHLTPTNAAEARSLVERLCREFDQEAYLEVSGHRAVTLWTWDEDRERFTGEHMGLWRASRSEAELEDASATTGYTVDLTTGIGYVVV